MNNLGFACGNMRDCRKQREFLGPALVINQKNYGPDHPEVRITLKTFARMLREAT